MSTGSIKKPATKEDYGLSEYVVIKSVATDGATTGYHIAFPTNFGFSLFYFGNHGYSGIITHAAYENAIVTEMAGTLPAKSSDDSNVYLRVGNWDRMAFILSSVNNDNINISTYTS